MAFDRPRCVLLRHDEPDGSWHFDLMIKRPPQGGSPRSGSDADDSPGTQGLLTFRIRARIDLPASRGGRLNFDATRLPDHRQRYLEYEGPISGGRGSVARLGRGDVIDFAEDSGYVRFILDFGHGPRVWIGREDPAALGCCGGARRWQFREVVGDTEVPAR